MLDRLPSQYHQTQNNLDSYLHRLLHSQGCDMLQSDSWHLPKTYAHDTNYRYQPLVSVLYRQEPPLPLPPDHQAFHTASFLDSFY